MNDKKIIVAKFGGSSMADQQAMQRSAKVAVGEKANLIVVSATYGSTNDLIALSELAFNTDQQECLQLLDNLINRHLDLAAQFDITADKLTPVKALCHELKTLVHGISLLKDCSPKTLDALLSIGERLSSAIFTKAVAMELDHSQKAVFFDVRKVMKTNNVHGMATPNLAQIKLLCDDHLMSCKYGNDIFITQGFIGSNAEGVTTTLGRGGSDYSAALLAEGMGADILQIWTDVAGIATTDPRICDKARPISKISFQEASELATFGAKILHPTTLAPVIRKNIPVFVGSSYHPEENGTWITKYCSKTDTPLVRALAIKRQQVLLTLTTPSMLHSYGFLFKVFSIFNRHKVSVDSITTSEISVALTIDDSALLNLELIEELETVATLKIEHNLSIISLIGNNINHTAGLAKKLFESLDDINVRMVCVGASKHNFCFLVSETDGDNAIKRLHYNFIECESGEQK